MCAAETKGTLSQDCKLVRKHVYVKLYKIFRNFFYVNLLINIVYYLYIDSYVYIYTPNQAICVAKLCVLLFFS